MDGCTVLVNKTARQEYPSRPECVGASSERAHTQRCFDLNAFIHFPCVPRLAFAERGLRTQAGQTLPQATVYAVPLDSGRLREQRTRAPVGSGPTTPSKSVKLSFARCLLRLSDTVLPKDLLYLLKSALNRYLSPVDNCFTSDACNRIEQESDARYETTIGEHDVGQLRVGQ